jgi:hypothetical protein
VGCDSSVGIATSYGDRIPVVARFSAPVQTGPGAHPASYTGPFRGVKRSGRGVDHPLPSSAEVKERVGLYLYSPTGPSWSVLGFTLLYFTLLTRQGRTQKGGGGEGLKDCSRPPNVNKKYKFWTSWHKSSTWNRLMTSTLECWKIKWQTAKVWDKLNKTKIGLCDLN